jgi:hypothetical protein
VTVYRKSTQDGEVIRDEKLHTDYYRPQKRVVRIGTMTPEDEETLEGEGDAGADGEPAAGESIGEADTSAGVDDTDTSPDGERSADGSE